MDHQFKINYFSALPLKELKLHLLSQQKNRMVTRIYSRYLVGYILYENQDFVSKLSCEIHNLYIYSIHAMEDIKPGCS